MAKKQTQNRTAASAADMDGNVDKIREILFGGQMRDYEQRFDDLERRLNKNVEQLFTDFEKRLDKLDAFSKREIDKLTELVKVERKARQDDGKQGSKDLKELAAQVESWCAELEEQIDSEVRELREIGDTRIAREDLAGWLTDAALRLKKGSK